MHSVELREKARNLYLKTRNIQRTYTELKRDGYVVSLNTIKGWKRSDNWDAASDAYDRQLAEFNQILIGYEQSILKNLISLSDKLFQTVNDNPADTQAVYSYVQVNKQIKDFQKQDKGDLDSEVLIDVLLADPEIGPLLKSRMDIILKRVEKAK